MPALPRHAARNPGPERVLLDRLAHVLVVLGVVLEQRRVRCENLVPRGSGFPAAMSKPQQLFKQTSDKTSLDTHENRLPDRPEPDYLKCKEQP